MPVPFAANSVPGGAVGGGGIFDLLDELARGGTGFLPGEMPPPLPAGGGDVSGTSAGKFTPPVAMPQTETQPQTQTQGGVALLPPVSGSFAEGEPYPGIPGRSPQASDSGTKYWPRITLPGSGTGPPNPAEDARNRPDSRYPLRGGAGSPFLGGESGPPISGDGDIGALLSSPGFLEYLLSSMRR